MSFLSKTPFIAAAAVVTLAAPLHAATIVTNNTGIDSTLISILDHEPGQATTSIYHGPGAGTLTDARSGATGTDSTGNAFGVTAAYAATGTVTFTFTGLTANASYYIYGTWYPQGSNNVSMDVTANSTLVGTFGQNGGQGPVGTNGFTATQTGDANTMTFQRLGATAFTTNGAGEMVVVASKTVGLGFFRDDAFAVAPVPEPSAALLGGLGALALLRRRRNRVNR